MPTSIDQQIDATGIAQVIAVLKSPAAKPPGVKAGGLALTATAAASPQLLGLEQYFVKSELSQNHAIALAGTTHIASLQSRGVTSTRSAGRIRTPPAVLHFPNLGVMLGTVTKEGLAGLRIDQRIDTVSGAPQPSLIRPVNVAAAKPIRQSTWGIEFLGVRRLWDQGLTGKGVRVGHLDTGADGKHPALRKAIASFAEFDSFGVQVTPSPKPYDTDDHGTHTAATIAGRPVSRHSVGVAPQAELASAIVIEGGNVIARILGGMDWALSQNVRILNMSLGLRGFFDDFLAVTQILRGRNVLPIFAVGNEGPGTSRSPGNYLESLSVGAHDKNGAAAIFSSSQRFVRENDPLVPDLVAPAVDVISAKPGGGFQLMSGTSMATPHVAGLAALLLEAKPNATADDIETAIFNSCSLAGIPAERGNRGFPDAVRAFTALTGTTLPTSTTRNRRNDIVTKKARRSGSRKVGKTSKKGGGVARRVARRRKPR